MRNIQPMPRKVSPRHQESTPHSSFNKDKAGFTFIELFIAISIFTVVAIALYSTFFAGISVWRRSGEDRDVYQNIRFVFDDMTKDFRNIVYCSEDEESMFAFSGMTDEVVFITSEGTFSEEDVFRKELAKVAYRLDRDAGELIRIRAGKSLGFNIEKAEKESLLKGIEDLKFEYCYDSDDEDDPYLWKEEWEDKEMRIPRGVMVTFHIKVEEEKEALKFTKTIFVPTGILGEGEIGL